MLGEINKIAGVEPLTEGPGDAVTGDVPAALAAALFGPVGGQEPRTYALIDGARFPGAAEHLEDAGLLHRSFFKGQALADLGDAGPWLAALPESGTFLRRLMTSGEAPWHFWDRGAVLYLRSGRDFDGLWSHLRKFTRMPGENGRSAFFRYWEPRLWEVFAARSGKLAALDEAFGRIFGGAQVILPALRLGGAFRFGWPPADPRVDWPAGLRADLRRARFYDQMFAQAADFHDSYPVETARYGDNPRDLLAPLFAAVDEVMDAGLSDPALRARFLLLGIIKHDRTWPAILREPSWARVRDGIGATDDRFRDLCALIKRGQASFAPAGGAWW